MRCPNCGKRFSERVNFCDQCGTRLNTAAPEAPPPKPEPNAPPQEQTGQAAPQEPPHVYYMPPGTPPPVQQKKNAGCLIVLIAAAVICVLFVVAVIFASNRMMQDRYAFDLPEDGTYEIVPGLPEEAAISDYGMGETWTVDGNNQPQAARFHITAS